MNEIFLIVGDYLKGKSIYSPARRVLNLLFNISIASFIYEKIYGQYSWLNYNDYKGILNFFIKGDFFIPFSIFIAVYCATQFFSIVIFETVNHFRTVKWIRSIIYFQVKKETIDSKVKELNKTSKTASPIRLTKSKMIDLYNHLRQYLTPEFYDNIKKELEKPKNNMEMTFHFIFRALITITVYFLSLPQFGWILFAITFLILVLSMYLIMIAYCFLDILPILVSKFHTEADKYIQSEQENN